MCGVAELTKAVLSWAVTKVRDALSGGDPVLAGTGVGKASSFANAA